MDKYRLKEDLQILDKTILKKESEISFDENNEFKISTEYGPITFTPEILKDKLEKVVKDLNVKVTVLDEEDENTIKNYRLQLDVKASRRKVREIENYLRRTFNIKPDDIIALCLDKSELMIITILAVWKSGAAYVPMDPNFPDKRIEYILNDTKSKIIIK